MSTDVTRRFSWRSFVWVLTVASFVGMVFTGIVPFIVPAGRVANWTGWTLLALTKHKHTSTSES